MNDYGEFEGKVMREYTVEDAGIVYDDVHNGFFFQLRLARSFDGKPWFCDDIRKVVVPPSAWMDMMDVFDDAGFYEPKNTCVPEDVKDFLVGKKAVLHTDEQEYPYMLVSTKSEHLTCPCDYIGAAAPISRGWDC